MKIIKNKSAAFTRGELLVVLLSVSLLITVVLPALSQARRPSRRILCAMNMKTMAQGMAQYASEQKSKLPHQAFWNSGPWTTTTLYHGSFLKANAPTDVGLCFLMKAFGPGSLYDTGILPRQDFFYCPGVAESASNSPPGVYTVDYYTHPMTGDLWYPFYDTRIRSTYNYFKNNILTIDQMAGRSYLYDIVDSWEYLPHVTANGTPEGMNVLYGDGRVVFNTDQNAFNTDLWNPGASGMDIPNNIFERWFAILDILGNNVPQIPPPGGSFINWQCNEKPNEGARMGQWQYSPAP